MSRSMVCLVLVLAGCPESKPEAPSGPIAAELGPGVKQRPTSDAPSMVVDGAGKDGPAAAGTFAGAIPESELAPQFTQEQLADGPVIRGTLACDGCAGKLLVRVLPPPPASPEEAAGTPDIQLVTAKVFDQVGPFEIRVPKTATALVLQVVDDANSDGLPSAGERMGMPLTGAVQVAPEVDGIVLTVGVFPEMAPVDATGNAMAAPEGKATDALPPGDKPAGEAPAGAGDAPATP